MSSQYRLLTEIQFRMLREPLIYSHMAATAAWRDEMQGMARNQGAFSLMAASSKATARFFFPATSLFDRAGFNGWETPWHF